MESVTPTHCLDACAVIAYLRQESGAEVLKRSSNSRIPSWLYTICNLGEVYYDFFREDGIETARTAWANTVPLPLTLRRDVDNDFVQRVRAIKVDERVSFADAFALALSERLQAPLVTTDRHQFDPIEQKGHFRFLWLR